MVSIAEKCMASPGRRRTKEFSKGGNYVIKIGYDVARPDADGSTKTIIFQVLGFHQEW